MSETTYFDGTMATFMNRLKSDELKFECGIRGSEQPEGTSVAVMRQVLSRLLLEEGEDALLPITEEFATVEATYSHSCAHLP